MSRRVCRLSVFRRLAAEGDDLDIVVLRALEAGAFSWVASGWSDAVHADGGIVNDGAEPGPRALALVREFRAAVSSLVGRPDYRWMLAAWDVAVGVEGDYWIEGFERALRRELPGERPEEEVLS